MHVCGIFKKVIKMQYVTLLYADNFNFIISTITLLDETISNILKMLPIFFLNQNIMI